MSVCRSMSIMLHVEELPRFGTAACIMAFGAAVTPTIHAMCQLLDVKPPASFAGELCANGKDCGALGAGLHMYTLDHRGVHYVLEHIGIVCLPDGDFSRIRVSATVLNS